MVQVLGGGPSQPPVLVPTTLPTTTTNLRCIICCYGRNKYFSMTVLVSDFVWYFFLLTKLL